MLVLPLPLLERLGGIRPLDAHGLLVDSLDNTQSVFG
jgi:hypothetical protein